jgi:beta-lactamase regulating signal transducer with metallopeptidase domain
MSTFTAILRSVFDWTWRTSLEASVLVLLVLLLQRLLKRWLTPRLRYALSFLLLCRLLLPIAPSSSLSFENLLKPTAQPVHFNPPPIIAASPILGTGSASSARARGLTLSSALCTTWVCGLLLLGALGFWRYYHWTQTIRAARQISDARLLQILDDVRREVGIRRPVALVSMPNLSSPAVFGFWRPHLLLPENTLRFLNDQEWRLVFLHEMTHVRNYDTVLNTILIAVQFLHWFNPFVWIALQRFRADRELVCDAIVIEHLKIGERLGYAQVLLRLAEAISDGPRAFPSAVPVVSRANEIKTRVTMIKHHRHSSQTARAVTIACILLLGLLTFTRARERELPTEGIATSSHVSSERDVDLIRHEFQTAGYSVPENVLDDLVQVTIRNEFGNRASLVKALEERGMTYKQFREQIKERMVAKLKAELGVTNIATNDQRALGFDWYLGNFLMTNRGAFSDVTAPTFETAPPLASPQGLLPGTSRSQTNVGTNQAASRVPPPPAVAAQPVPKPTPAVVSNAAPKRDPGLKLNGIAQGATTFAIINGKGVGEGQTVTLPLKPKPVAVHCLKIETNAVLVRVEGEDVDRRLSLR